MKALARRIEKLEREARRLDAPEVDLSPVLERIQTWVAEQDIVLGPNESLISGVSRACGLPMREITKRLRELGNPPSRRNNVPFG